MFIFDPFVITIVFFGLWVCYTDIKNGKIKNIAIVLMIISGIILNLFISKNLVEMPVKVILNSSIALIFGYLIWLIGLWSAGDAKLFFAFSLIIPITAYNNFDASVFPSLSILINTFAPIALFFVIKSLLKPKIKKIIGFVKKYFLSRSIIDTSFFIFAFSVPMDLLLSFFGIQISRVFEIILLIILLESLRKVKWIPFKHFTYIFSVLNVIFFFNEIANIDFVQKFILGLFIFQTIRVLLDYLTEIELSKSVKIRDLKKGMFLLDSIIEKDGEYQKRSFSFISMFNFIYSAKENMKSTINRKLDEENIKKIRKLKKQGKLKFDDVRISQEIPFAPFMFLGVMITYFSQIIFLVHLITLKDYIILYIQLIYHKIILFLK